MGAVCDIRAPVVARIRHYLGEDASSYRGIPFSRAPLGNLVKLRDQLEVRMGEPGVKMASAIFPSSGTNVIPLRKDA